MRKEDFLTMVQKMQATAGDAKASVAEMEELQRKFRANPVPPPRDISIRRADRPSVAGGLRLVGDDP